jgi:hypothetical protein
VPVCYPLLALFARSRPLSGSGFGVEDVGCGASLGSAPLPPSTVLGEGRCRASLGSSPLPPSTVLDEDALVEVELSARSCAVAVEVVMMPRPESEATPDPEAMQDGCSLLCACAGHANVCVLSKNDLREEADSRLLP